MCPSRPFACVCVSFRVCVRRRGREQSLCDRVQRRIDPVCRRSQPCLVAMTPCLNTTLAPASVWAKQTWTAIALLSQFNGLIVLDHLVCS